MKRFVLSAVLCLGLASPALAKELAGVKMEDTIRVDGKQLRLNGLGLRRRSILDVYVAGLYVQNYTKDGYRFLAADETRAVKLRMKRDVPREEIVQAIREGFVANAAAKMPELRERLNTLLATVPAVKEGDVLTIAYVPGKGTILSTRTREEAPVEGKDFADALFAVFVGSRPVDPNLKAGLLNLVR